MANRALPRRPPHPTGAGLPALASRVILQALRDLQDPEVRPGSERPWVRSERRLARADARDWLSGYSEGLEFWAGAAGVEVEVLLERVQVEEASR